MIAKVSCLFSWPFVLGRIATYGGGVCLYGTFYLSGDSIIQDNTKAGTTDNLYLGWNTIGLLGENAHIGVNAEGIPPQFHQRVERQYGGRKPGGLLLLRR